jgi:hypothetical protein
LKDTSGETYIWEHVVPTGGSYVTPEVSVRKCWKHPWSGERKSLHSFYGSELYALAQAIERAEARFLDRCAESCGVPQSLWRPGSGCKLLARGAQHPPTLVHNRSVLLRLIEGGLF